MTSPRLRPAELGADPVLWLAAGLGSGLSPVAPGTFGSLAGLLLALPLLLLPPYALWIAAALAALIGIPICGIAARRLGVHDHSGIVWDEIAGIWLTLALLPHHWLGLVLAFALFRAFDVLKPWPICWLDRHLHGGLGIMADDLVAGLFAGVVGRGILLAIGM